MLTIKDKNKIDELEKFGNVIYVSDYTSLVGFECPEENVKLLAQHPNVIELNESCTGSLQ
jgi:uncharacterized protein YlbG (UPF0298 family)